jgi:hypothetical protein
MKYANQKNMQREAMLISILIFGKILILNCKMKCACCGEEMILDRESEKTFIYKCTGCGLTDSRLKA